MMLSMNYCNTIGGCPYYDRASIVVERDEERRQLGVVQQNVRRRVPGRVGGRVAGLGRAETQRVQQALRGTRVLVQVTKERHVALHLDRDA